MSQHKDPNQDQKWQSDRQQNKNSNPQKGQPQQENKERDEQKKPGGYNSPTQNQR